jgi:hypothetical protein
VSVNFFITTYDLIAQKKVTKIFINFFVTSTTNLPVLSSEANKIICKNKGGFMDPGMIVGSIFFLTTAFVLFSYIYFRSRERQMMIEKGLSVEQINELFKAKRNPVTWLRIGIVVLCFGVALGAGLGLYDSTGSEYWIPFFIISGIGSGFIAAFFLGKKYDKNGN